MPKHRLNADSRWNKAVNDPEAMPGEVIFWLPLAQFPGSLHEDAVKSHVVKKSQRVAYRVVGTGYRKDKDEGYDYPCIYLAILPVDLPQEIPARWCCDRY